MADNFRGLTTGATLGRELPFSQEAEEAVLGGVLRDPSVLPKVIEILKPESFYRPQHQQLFTIIVRMFTTGSKEDLITVINEAVTMGVLKRLQWLRIIFLVLWKWCRQRIISRAIAR